MNKIFNAKYFSRLAKSYTSYALRHKWAVPDFISGALAPYIPQNPINPIRVIDVGIGTGLVSNALKNRYNNLQVIGFDFSPGMVKICQENGSVDLLVVADAEDRDFPFASGVFDLAVASGVFEFFADPRHALEEMIRVTKPGGIVAFSYLATNSSRTHKYVDFIEREAYCQPAQKIEELASQLNICKLEHTKPFTSLQRIFYAPKYAIFAGQTSKLIA